VLPHAALVFDARHPHDSLQLSRLWTVLGEGLHLLQDRGFDPDRVTPLLALDTAAPMTSPSVAACIVKPIITIKELFGWWT
jgi:hypothetical protein